MSVYMTEDEQIEVIKKWWKRYGNTIMLLFSLVLLSYSAYKYWNWHQEKISIEASVTYERLMVASANGDERGIQAYSNTLINDFNKSVYAYAARLALAKVYVSKSQYDKAIETLQYVTTNSPMTVLKQVARIRLARILTATKSYDKALAELALIDDNAFLPLINELKGDIYYATGKQSDAVKAYRSATNAVQTEGLGNLYLEMKTSELAALTRADSQLNSAVKAA